MRALTCLVWTASLTGVVAGFVAPIGDHPIPAVVVLIASAAVAAVSWWAGGPLADAVRTADDEIGIPVPDDLAEAVAHSRNRFDVLGDRLALATSVPAQAAQIRPLLREIGGLDDRYTHCLHRARTAWALGRVGDWRWMVVELVTIGEELDHLDHRIPPPLPVDL